MGSEPTLRTGGQLVVDALVAQGVEHVWLELG